MALAVNRTGVILKKRDMSYHRSASVKLSQAVRYCQPPVYVAGQHHR
jgi:hypothetical protein